MTVLYNPVLVLINVVVFQRLQTKKEFGTSSASPRPPTSPLLFIYRFHSEPLKVSVSCSVVSDSLQTPWPVAHWAPLFMGFSRQEYWTGFPFPSPGNLPDLGIKSGPPTLQAYSLLSEPSGKPVSNLFALQVSFLKRSHFPEGPFTPYLGRSHHSPLPVLVTCLNVPESWNELSLGSCWISCLSNGWIRKGLLELIQELN